MGGSVQCSDCIDNDGDGKIDGFDPECAGPNDNREDSFATGLLELQLPDLERPPRPVEQRRSGPHEPRGPDRPGPYFLARRFKAATTSFVGTRSAMFWRA